MKFTFSLLHWAIQNGTRNQTTIAPPIPMPRPVEPDKPELTPAMQDAIEVLIQLGERKNEAPRQVLIALRDGVDENDAQAIVTHVMRYRM